MRRYLVGRERTPHPKAENALRLALEIRKFEIDLYWKRATYFWAFLAVTFAGYVTVLGSKDIPEAEKSDPLLVICCLGVVFSLAWYLVNRGSKFWQENWENHVDMLEDDINGPLYKTILSDADARFWRPWSAHPFSVSKINQILSFFILLLFLILTFTTLNQNYSVCGPGPVDWLATLTVGLTVTALPVLCIWGRSKLSEISETPMQYRTDFNLRPPQTDIRYSPPKQISKIKAMRRWKEIV